MPKTKRIAYDAEFKLKAISLAEVKGNRKSAFELGINESMVRKWRLQRSKLQACKKTRKSFRTCSAKWPELETDLLDWVQVLRGDGRGLNTVQLRLKAIEMAKAKGITEFSGSASWCFRFMRRHNLSVRAKTTLCEQVPADLQEKLQLFRNFTNEQIAENMITSDFIINMDEVPLTFDMPLTRTINPKGESTIALKTTGHEKTHFTVVLACTASGKKLPPMTIFKRKTKPKEKFPSGIVVKNNPKGWMDEQMMVTWLNECYSKRPGGFFRRSKSLLMLDSMRAHITEPVKQAVKATNSILSVIPGGTTKFLQPLDIAVNRTFKVNLRALWEKWMTSGDHAFTKTGRMKRASLAEVCCWITSAWDDVPARVITSGFRKAEVMPADSPSSADDEAVPSTSTADDSRAESEDDVTSGISAEAFMALFVSDTEESDFSGFSGAEEE